MGALEILNVSEGDMKISFDTNDCAEAIRAKRIIKDMLRRGYALLVDGQRIKDFDETKGEYIIADFDAIESLNVEMAEADQRLKARREADDRASDEWQARRDEVSDTAQPAVGSSAPVKRGRGRPPNKRVPMHKTTANAVAPRVGG